MPSRSNKNIDTAGIALLLFVFCTIAPASSFSILPATQTTPSTIQCWMSKSEPQKNPEIAKQLERAKAALAISRAKMEAQEFRAETGLEEEEEEPEESLPFFAASEDGKKDKVIKDKNKDGAFTTDGDLMAKLSEEEEWESRSLLEVFQNEKEESPDAVNIDRDIAQAMYNLQKSLQTEDFRTIFDKRNRYIGES